MIPILGVIALASFAAGLVIVIPLLIEIFLSFLDAGDD